MSKRGKMISDLPKILHRYTSADFGIQQRVRFFYRLCNVIIICLFFILIYTSYIQLNDPKYGGALYFPVILPEIFILILTIASRQLLISGYFKFSTHLLFLSIIVTAWSVIIFDKGSALVRFDTIVYIFAFLTMLPLVFFNHSRMIWIYTLTNILALWLFVFVFQEDIGISNLEVIDLLADISIALLFVGIVSYNIFNINKRSLERAIWELQEKHEAEKALLESEKKYTDTIDLLPQTIYEADITGKLTYANKKGFEAFEYSIEDFNKGIFVTDMLIEEDRIIAMENFKNNILGTPITKNQYTAKKKSGKTFPVQIFSKPIYKDGKTVGLRGIIIDITERIITETEIKKSRDQFLSLVSNIPGATYRCKYDKSWTMIFLSSEIEKLSGYPASDFINNNIRSFESIIFYDDRKIVFDQIDSSIKASIPWEIEYRIRHKNGNINWVYEKGRAVLNEGEGFGYLDGFILDITQKKQAEISLRESEERIRSLIESLNEAIIVADNDHKVEYINKQFTEKLGYTQSEIVGKIGYKFLHDPRDLALVEEANRLRKANEVSSYELTFIAKDGRKIDFLVSGAPIKNADGMIVGSVGALLDISEQKRAAMALKESEERYRTLFENAQIGIYQTTPDGRILNVNPAMLEMLGYDSLEELNTINLEENSLQVRNRGGYKDLIEGQGFVRNYETVWRTKSGELINILENARVVKNSEGAILYYDGFVENITERKAAEKALKDSQQLFETLAQYAPVGIFRTRPDGYTTYVNPKWCEMSGLSYEEALGDGWLKAVHPENRQQLKGDWDTHASNKERSFAEYRFLKPDGSVVWVLGDAVPEIIDNKVQGYIGTLTNITERKKAEEILARTNAQLKGVLDAATEISIIATYPNGDIVVFNKGAEKMLGYTEDEVVGKKTPQFIHLESEIVKKGEELSKLYNKRIEGFDVFVEQAKHNINEISEWTYVCKDGSHKIVNLGVTAVRNQSREIIGYLGIAIDVTENKKTGQELEKYRNHLELLVKERTEELAAANEELITTNEELHYQRKELEGALIELKNAQDRLIQSEKMAALGVLSAGVAHEINNPLNFIYGGIIGLEQYLQNNHKDIPPEVQIMVEGIHTGVERATNIVKSLNHYSRRDDLPLVSCDIHAILDNCLVILQEQIKSRIEVEKNYTKTNYQLLGNEGKLHQAMLNVLSNAVQAIETTGKISISTLVNKKAIKIIIRDTGCGIAKDHLPKILDPFFTTKEPGKGTGLGLSITYSLLQELRGTISFESEQANGTTVTIKLPVA